MSRFHDKCRFFKLITVMTDGMMDFDDDASQSSRTLIPVHYKLPFHNLDSRKERPAYRVVTLPNTLHAVQYMLHGKQRVD